LRDFEQEEIAHEDAIAPRYNRDYHDPPLLKRHHEDFAAFVAGFYQPGDRVLDLGCGAASMWPHWLKHLKSPGALIGVDISPGMLEHARRAVPNGDFREGSILNLPLESQSIDLVIASSTLHHLPDDVLPEAFAEISRVMTEHATLVGREPVDRGRLADEPGWMSGAIMAFRHLAMRLTRTREYGEPPNGEHHHAYDPELFAAALSRVFAPKGLQFRHPFSFYVGRVRHPLVVAMANWFDEWLDHRWGQEFYYAASKNFADAADVAEYVQRELNGRPEIDRAQFMAHLQEAAALLERELADELTRSRNGKDSAKK
jgi:SAM-dependent methyltransferase